MAVGNINSNERGSGARYNDGKAPHELLPLRAVGELAVGDSKVTLALRGLGKYQNSAHFEYLIDAAHALYSVTGVRQAMDDVARVFDYGRNKYAAWNWAKGMAWSIPLACASRHLLSMNNGEWLDQESGLPHYAHALCNILMLATFARTYPDGNDLPVGVML